MSDGNKQARGWDLIDGERLKRPPETLAALVYVVGGLFLLAIFCALLWRLLEALWAGEPAQINQLLLAGAAMLAAPFGIWRVVIAARTNHIAQENLYTTLLTKAIEQLGAVREVKETRESLDDAGKAKFDSIVKTVPNLEVRLGAIYALEKLARDYEPLHWPIMEIWPAAGFVDAEKRCFMKLEVCHGETDI